jgi:ATP-dependent exoDNAse (exonuclease V) beta subunit
MHGRLVDAPEEDVRSAVGTVSKALGHPFMKRVQAAELAHRELPVTLKVREDRILEGVIDLAFLEDATWYVVDFKTDADITARLEHHRFQLGWYRHAMAKITGLPAKGYLLAM